MYHYRVRICGASVAIIACCFFGIGKDVSALEAVRHIPARDLPVPDTVSTELQKMMAAQPSPGLDLKLGETAELKKFVAKVADQTNATIPALAKKFQVDVTSMELGGVPTFSVTPANIPERNRNRLLIYFHGGAYLFSPGLSGTREAIAMAGYGNFKIISVDYRMLPDFPYPAALDDAVAVWKAAIKMVPAENIAVFGSSAGGGLALSFALTLKKEGLPLPGALGLGSPWSEMSGRGDTFATNAFVDNYLVTNAGFLDEAAKMYANGIDLRDPRISPIYGDLRGLPPAILTSGTRDLFLSNTVRTHQELRRAGVPAELQVFEGMSHMSYAKDPFMPESKDAYLEIAGFFDQHLKR